MRYFSFLVFLLNFLISQAQDDCKCDVSEETMRLYNENRKNGDPDKIKLLADRLSSMKFKSCKIMALNFLGKYCIEQGEYEQAEKNLWEGRRLMDKPCYDSLKCLNYLAFLELYKRYGMNDSSSFYGFKAIELSEANNFQTILIASLDLTSGNLIRKGDFANAIKYGRLAVTKSLKSKNYFEAARVMGNHAMYLGWAYEASGTSSYLDSAISCQLESIRLGNAYGNKSVKVYGYLNLANLYGFRAEYKKGFASLDTAYKYSEGDPKAFLSIMGTRSNFYTDLKDYNKALLYCDSAYKIARRFYKGIEVAITLENLSDAYANLGDHKKALSLYKQMKLLEDSINTVEKSEVIAEMEQKYNKSQNEKTIKELAQEKEILNKESEISTLKINLLVAGIFMAIGIIVLVIVIYRQKNIKQNQALIETEQRLNRSRINPHFFFNVLSSLQFLAAKEEDKKKLVGYFFSFSKLMRQTLESTYDDYVSLNEEIDFISHYLKLQELKRTNLFAYTIHVQDSIDKEKVKVPAMLLQPFLENSIEHGFSGMESGGLIDLNFAIDQHELLIEIKDNGKGMDVERREAAHVSRATQITNDRLFLINKQKKTNARFAVSKNEPTGTCIKIFLPLS